MKHPGRVLSGPEALAPDTAVQALVPYPYSSTGRLIGGEFVPELSNFTRESMDAGVIAWSAHVAADFSPKVILLGETCYPDDLPNTTDLMEIRGREQGIDDNAFVPLTHLRNGKRLNNTYRQTEALNNYLWEHGEVDPAEVIVSAKKYHLGRVINAVYAHRRLRAVRFVGAEAILHTVGNHTYDKYIPAVDELSNSFMERAVGLLTSTVDRRGRVPNLLVDLKGARIVDAVEDEENGGFKLESGLALAKYRTLLAAAHQQSGALSENG